jgi:hypothetical protein
LSGLPDQYVGGLLTTNSLNSSNVLGLETDPRGYTQIVDSHGSIVESTLKPQP